MGGFGTPPVGKWGRVSKEERATFSNLRLIDRGRSSFKGNRQKALAEFIRAIDRQLVKPGDILLVEAIDRLSRRGIRQTQDLVKPF